MTILAQLGLTCVVHGRLIAIMKKLFEQNDSKRRPGNGGDGDDSGVSKDGAAPGGADRALWEGPAIMLVDLDAFFASVEQLDHPAWRGKPVIVGGDADKHGVVSTASYEARRYGVRSAMPSSVARRLCPDAVWTQGRFDRYRELSNAVMEILWDETPHVQQVSIDEAFCDISPTAVNREHPVGVAQRVQRRVERLGVTCSIGLGTSKTIAKIASDMEKPQGLVAVYPGGERAFLAPLPVRTMSGVGESAEKKLKAQGIRTLGDLADADEGMLLRLFGKSGRVMHLRANGGDDAPVESGDAVKSISNETTFAADLTTREDVEAAIATMAAKVGRRMRKKGLHGRTLSLRVRFDDRSTRSVQRRLDHASDDELSYTPLLFHMVDELWHPGTPVRLIGVAMTGFEGDAIVQQSLFDLPEEGGSEEVGKPALEDEARRRGLIEATDLVKNRFGESAVRFGRELRGEGNTTGSSSKNPEDYK